MTDLRAALRVIAATADGLTMRETNALSDAFAILGGRPDLARAVRDALITSDPSGVVEALP